MTTLVAQENRAVAQRTPVRCVPEIDATRENVDAEGMAAVFKALGSPVRLRLLAVVQAAPNGEARVCELVAAIKLTQSTVSHHLRILVGAGLMYREQRGTWAWYRLIPERLEAVRKLLANPDDLHR